MKQKFEHKVFADDEDFNKYLNEVENINEINNILSIQIIPVGESYQFADIHVYFRRHN